MRQLLVLSLGALLLALASARAIAQPAPQLETATRGQLLYETHCVRCHARQIHWRAARAARDWTTLRAQVQKWQGEAGQQWPDEDIDAVARYLNETIYHFPELQQRG